MDFSTLAKAIQKAGRQPIPYTIDDGIDVVAIKCYRSMASELKRIAMHAPSDEAFRQIVIGHEQDDDAPFIYWPDTQFNYIQAKGIES
jgi:hypothetical protein